MPQFSAIFTFTLLTIPLIGAEMWMHVSVQSIDRKPCPSDETSWGTETAGCAAMSYMTLDERILPHHERRSSSFEHINGVVRPTVTHWPKGRIADWMISIQFISVDPVYGLARTCDRSGYIRVFQNESNQDFEKEFVEKTVKIQGQCFSATVLVQASHEVCPWCVDSSKTTEAPTTTTTETPTTVSPLGLFFQTENSFLLSTMLILALFSFLALLSTTVLLIIYVCDRRKNAENNNIFEMPLPQANSTIIVKSDSTAPFSTKSSEKWSEYGSETWSSFHPLDIEAAYIPARETRVYKVVHQQDDDDYFSDSGNGSA
uniref:C2 domain-containing protein n=1 Tax=Caenorhabditis japonica TaxID=281687 RepID=A0A8R1HYD2_CAEJA